MTYNNESLNLFFFSHYHSKMCVIRGLYSEDLAYLIFNFIWLAFQN